MIDTYFSISFILIMAMAIAVFCLLIPLLFIQHKLHKKIFDPIYFNNNYYSSYELSIFSTFPLMFIKTLGYIKAIVFPNKMRRKFQADILQAGERPVIYTLALTTILILFISALIILNTGIVGVLIILNS